MYQEITPEQLDQNVFTEIGKTWMLITAQKEGKQNAMTASWGGLGVMWGKNVAFSVIRPQRYTKEFVDASERFSLCFLGDAYKKEKAYMGAVSGRDEDKIAKMGLSVAHIEEVPYFEESQMVIVCRKLYQQEYKEECFLEKELVSKWYPEKDFHTLYISEIEKILIKKHAE